MGLKPREALLPAVARRAFAPDVATSSLIGRMSEKQLDSEEQWD